MEKFGKICKEYMVDEIAEHFRNYPNFFVTTFSQVGVEDIQKLRKSFKKTSALYMVVKNSMLKRALSKVKKDIALLQQVKPLVAGSCGIFFSKESSVEAARSLVNFNKDHESFKIQGGLIDGKMVSLDTIKLLASLPSREVLLAMVAFNAKAPISGFVKILKNLLRNLVGVIDAISKKEKES